MKTKKVFSGTRFKTSESTSTIKADAVLRAVVVGRKDGASGAGFSSLIGKVIEQASSNSLLDYSAWLDLTFPHVVGIFGSRGSGKSFDLGVIAEGACRVGPVTDVPAPTHAIILFDVQDQFWTLGIAPSSGLPEDKMQLHLLQQWGLDVAAVSNMRLWATEGYKTPLQNVGQLHLSPSQLTPDDWLAFLELDRFSSTGQTLLTLLQAHPTDTPDVLAQRCVPSQLLGAFQNSTIEAVRWRLESFANLHLVTATGVSLEEFLVPGAISLILMRQLSDSLRTLIVGVLTRLSADKMSYLHQQRRVARRTRQQDLATNLPDRLTIILDEAHVLVPSGNKTAASDPIIDYVKRGRDAGLSLIFATQQPSAIDPSLMSQVDITLTHYLGFDSDISAAIARMPTLSAVTFDIGANRGLTLPSVIRSLSAGECVVADAAYGRAFLVAIRPRVTAHGGNTPA